jgi:type IV/VI secretion system ImpK/VasF family protein
MATNLLELCEPLFQYVCALNRSGRKRVMRDAGQVRADLNAIFSKMKSESGSVPGLRDQFEKVELPLIFFVDSMIEQSQLAFAGSWKRMSHERKEMAGDEKFFELLEETLLENGEAANQRLAVFYTCIGLGFTGIYTGQPDELKRKMMSLGGRLRGIMEVDQESKICPDAYEKVDTRKLFLRSAPRLVGLVIVVVGIVAALIAAQVYLYRSSTSRLRDALDGIIAASQSTPSESPPASADPSKS